MKKQEPQIKEDEQWGMTDNLGGRPRAFKTVQELEDAIQAYFDECNSRTVQVYDRDNG